MFVPESVSVLDAEVSLVSVPVPEIAPENVWVADDE